MTLCKVCCVLESSLPVFEPLNFQVAEGAVLVFLD